MKLSTGWALAFHLPVVGCALQPSSQPQRKRERGEREERSREGLEVVEMWVEGKEREM